jgi:hypothetical protein
MSVRINRSTIASWSVSVALAIIVGVPLIYYAFIIGADVGVRASRYSHGLVREDFSFVGGSILGGAAAFFATGFLATRAARLVGWAMSGDRRR